MVNIQLKLTGLVVQLLVLQILLSDVSAKLLLGYIEGLYTFVSVRLKLLDLTLESLFVFFITFLMFALDDFLCGLCNSVELYILCSLLEVLYLKFHALIDCLNDLQLCLVV